MKIEHMKYDCRTKWRYREYIAASIFTFTLVAIFFASLNAVRVQAAELKAAPSLYLPEDSIDLGSVIQGQVAQGKFTIFNNGSAPLEILEMKTSCGCTVAEMDTKTIPPSGKVEIKVSVNTADKVGRIRKSIDIKTNDPNAGEVRLSVYVFVRINAHAAKARKGSSLFTGKCASCHAEPAKGLVDEPLFEAVCAMCHGHYGLGGEAARRINDLEYLDDKSLAEIRKAIAEGAPGSSMPGFSKRAGGPLSKLQIDSLVGLIQWWKKGYVFRKNEERQR